MGIREIFALYITPSIQDCHHSCTLYTCGKYCGTMNDDNLESKALCKVQKFHECSFCSNRRHGAGKLLVSYKRKLTSTWGMVEGTELLCSKTGINLVRRYPS